MGPNLFANPTVQKHKLNERSFPPSFSDIMILAWLASLEKRLALSVTHTVTNKGAWQFIGSRNDKTQDKTFVPWLREELYLFFPIFVRKSNDSHAHTRTTPRPRRIDNPQKMMLFFFFNLLSLNSNIMFTTVANS